LLRLGIVFLLLAAIRVCNAVMKTKTVPADSPTPWEQIAANDNQTDELQKQIEQIASAAKGRVGVAAEVLETAESVSLNPHEHFPMQSVYKLPIGMTVLAQVDKGKLNLEQRVRVEKSDFVHSGQHSPIRDKNPKGVELSLRELLRYAVSESDGTASDVLLRLVGVDAVKKYLGELGISEIIVANSEKEIGQDWQTQYRNWASPDASIHLLSSLHERHGISEQSQQLLYKFMIETPTFPTRLKGLLPKTAVIAHKTGSSGSNNGITAATNDIGLITLPNGLLVAIAVYVSDSPADLATREKVIAQITKAVWDSFNN
jgi:beta-lactamase class A